MSKEVELPPLDVTEVERSKGQDVVRSYRDLSGSDYRKLYAVLASWFYCRERQLRESLAKVAMLEDEAETMEELSNAKLPCGHHYGYAFTDNGGKTGFCTLCRNADLTAQVDEKDAEIDSLTSKLASTEYGGYKSRISILDAELATVKVDYQRIILECERQRAELTALREGVLREISLEHLEYPEDESDFAYDRAIEDAYDAATRICYPGRERKPDEKGDSSDGQ